MKKWVLLLLASSLLILPAYALFSNGFSHIEKIKVQKYDHKTEEYDTGKIIKDISSIKHFTKILNRADREKNVNYKLAYHDDYKVTLTYEDETTEVLFVWRDFGSSTFIKRSLQNEVFRIKNDSRRKDFLVTLK